MSGKKAPPAPPPGTGIFLMSENTLYGPYSPREVDFLREKGAFSRFSWIWNEREQRWQGLEAGPTGAPPPPPSSAERTRATRSRTTPSRAASPAAERKPLKIRALCFDRRNAVTGWVSQLNREGAIFVTQDERTLPPFSRRQKISLNLILQGSAQSFTVEGELARYARAKKGWQYEIRWRQFPKELTQLIEIILPRTET